MRRYARLGFAAILALTAAAAWTGGLAQPASPLRPIERIEVHKAERTLLLFAQDREVARIEHIQLGGAPVGAKHFEGDQKTPEGRYTIDFAKPDSAYHLALHVSYPNADDRAYAAARGLGPGRAIFIHGQPNDWPLADRGIRVPGDWTAGCIALSDRQIEMLWASVGTGTEVDILP